nr:hypothetical protein CFP56_55709 [Quercus suber]
MFKWQEREHGHLNSSCTISRVFCFQIAGRSKTLRGCAIRPPKEDNITHTRTPKCDEAFSVVHMYQCTGSFLKTTRVLEVARIL